MIENKNNLVIETKNVEKKFFKYKAVDKLNLQVKKGEIVALLGSNGAGKTTLISNICGISSITSCKINVCGFDVIK